MFHVNQLTGFGAGGQSLTSIAFQSSTTATTSSITCPTVQPFDVAVLFDWAYSLSAVSEVYPSDFGPLISQTDNFGGVFYRGCISYKLLNGGESGTSLAGMNESGMGKTLLVFRPNGVIGTVTASTWIGEITINNPSSQLIGASGQPAPLVRFAYGAVNVTTTPDFSVGTFDATVTVSTGSARSRAGYAVQNSSPSDDTVDMTDYGGNWLASGYLRFA